MVKWALNEGGEVRNVHHSRNFEKGRRDSFLSPGSRSGGKAELKALICTSSPQNPVGPFLHTKQSVS